MGFGKNPFHRRIMPNTCSSYSGHKNKNLLAEEVILFRMFYFVGLVFPADSKSTFSKTLLHKLLEHGATLFLIIHTAGDFYSLFKLISKLPIGLTCTSLFSNIFSISLRLTLLRKRRAILSLMNHLQNVDSNSSSNKRVSRRGHIIAGICICYIFPGFIMWFVISLCYQESKKVTFYMEDAFWLEFKSSENQRRGSAFQILPGVLQQCLRMHVSDGTGLLTATAARFRIRSLLHVQCHHVLDDSKFRQCSDISTDRASSPALYDDDWLYVASFQAVAVHDAAIEVRNSIHKVVSKSDSADYKTKCLLLAMASNFPSKVVVTGWRLFALKRGFLKKNHEWNSYLCSSSFTIRKASCT
ncbi:uncharacterized protein CEXT_65411 [Caerostris extrusa]|uniref:Vomeronasal type-1 receptor n=1 Tax=Caerostris extrusa TaxID=172846 RepID=A0AAV4V329_CAEEX|nr:uncharacterized protein CEXT_65411 [Caerostris extrusa]